jgi:LPS-assembly protein
MKKLLFLIICIIPAIVSATVVAEFDDWVESHTCSQASNILCAGYYKPLPLPPAGTQGSAQPIKVTADSANFVAKGTSVFTGNVIAAQGDKVIYADRAEVVHNATTGELETITAFGHVKIMQPGMRVDGSKAIAYVGEHRESLDNPVYRIYDRHARGVATSVVITDDNKMVLKNSTYTTCAPGSNAWYLKASSIDLDKESGRGEAWNARMYAKDVPIFYFPYVNFPIDKRRQTGFLQPAIEDSTLNGWTFTAPYYLNLAPNYDATISTNYMTLRSFKFDTVFRYLTRHSSGAFNFDFLPHDRAYQALRNEAYSDTSFMTSTDPNDVVRRNDLKPHDFRYRFAWKDNTYFTPNWLLTTDYTTASDGNYLFDFKPSSSNYITDQNSNIYALQRAALQNYSKFGVLRAQIEHYEVFQVLDGPGGTEQLSKLPVVDFNSIDIPVALGVNTFGIASYANFRPNVIEGSGTTLTYGQRYHIRPGVSYPITHPGWFVLPRFQLNYVQYTDLNVSPTDLANGVNPNNPNLAIPMYDLKTGMIFERNTKFRNTAFQQTLEPLLYYLYVPSKNQNALPNLDSGLLTFDYNQVFRDNRYTGGDYVSDANQLGMGIATRFYDSSGEEFGMAAIGKIKYFRNNLLIIDEELDNTNTSWSPYALVAKLRIAPDYNFEANLATTNKTTETASFQIQYNPSPVRVINFSYQYVADSEPDDLTGLLNSNLSQVSVSSAWQIAAPWRVLGKVNYDLRFHRFLETIAGVEYHTCCTALRVIWSRIWLPEISTNHGHDNVLKIQFIFKGVAGVGTASDNYISSVIPGYRASSY